MPTESEYMYLFYVLISELHFSSRYGAMQTLSFWDVKGHSSSRKSSHNIHHIHSPNWCMDHLSKVFPFVNKIQPYWAVSVWVLSLATLGKNQSIKCHQTPDEDEDEEKASWTKDIVTPMDSPKYIDTPLPFASFLSSKLQNDLEP